ncbi:hypothetical protein L596_008961 [Steinernema carpocapsae]|uniref:Uncharacterized protein n=1 Tax=Steinernema carpocapsae TaxID=34508 RepID=A0A4U5PEI0_STECR|nr:hypothetical protein L596_008961 [Steinernema carpocapsae]
MSDSNPPRVQFESKAEEFSIPVDHVLSATSTFCLTPSYFSTLRKTIAQRKQAKSQEMALKKTDSAAKEAKRPITLEEIKARGILAESGEILHSVRQYLTEKDKGLNNEDNKNPKDVEELFKHENSGSHHSYEVKKGKERMFFSSSRRAKILMFINDA